MKNNSFDKKISLNTSVLVLLVFGVVLIFAFITDTKSTLSRRIENDTPVYESPKIDISVPPIQTTDTPITSPLDEVTQKELVYFIKTINDKTSVIFELDGSNFGKVGVEYTKYLYLSLADEPKIVKIDTTNGNKQLVFDAAVFNKTDESSYIFEMKFLNDKIFFSTGGYMSKGGIYVLDPKKDTVRLIQTGENGSFVTDYGTNFIYFGDGDACASWSGIYTFDYYKEKATKLIETKSGCAGDGVILTHMGNDKRGNVLLATNEWIDNQDRNEFYTLEVLNVSTKNRATYLTRSQMPKGVNEMHYLPEVDQMALLTQTKKYVYSFITNQLREVTELPPVDFIESSAEPTFIEFLDKITSYRRTIEYTSEVPK